MSESHNKMLRLRYKRWGSHQIYGTSKDYPRPPGKPHMMAFGCSFVTPLSLITHLQLSTFRFSGATAKGIRKGRMGVGFKIMEAIRIRKPHSILLHFGSVDMNCAYAHKVLETAGPVNVDEYVEKALERYTSWIGDIQDTMCYLFTISMPIVPDEHIIASYVRYAKLDKDDLAKHVRLFDIKTRRQLVTAWNDGLKNFVDRNPLQCKLIQTEDNSMSPTSANLTNVHVNWEDSVRVWVDRLKINGIVFTKDLFTVDLKQSDREYRTFLKRQIQDAPVASEGSCKSMICPRIL